MLVLLGGCATGHPRGSSERLRPPLAHPFRPRRPASSPVRAEAGGRRRADFPGQRADTAPGPAVLRRCWPCLRAGPTCPPATRILLAPLLGVLARRIRPGAATGGHAPAGGGLGGLGRRAAGRPGARARRRRRPCCNRKRAAFLLTATERYGLVAGRGVCPLHPRTRPTTTRCGRCCGCWPGTSSWRRRWGSCPPCARSWRRGACSSRTIRTAPSEAGDVLRGLGRAARDALSSSQASDGARLHGLLRPARAIAAALPAGPRRGGAGAGWLRHFSPGNVALGSFDSLTFGVPLGFYHLVAGTGHGALHPLSGPVRAGHARAGTRGAAGGPVRGRQGPACPLRGSR